MTPRWLDTFPELTVAVLGDSILDVYLDGAAERVCREAPVPVVTLASERRAGGGAANTASNLAALGAQVRFVTVTGADADGESLAEVLRSAGVTPDSVVADPSRATVAKRRVVADGQLLLRLDTGTLSPVSADASEAAAVALREAVRGAHALIVSDYQLGLIGPHLLATLAELRPALGGPLVIDSTRLSAYRALAPDLVKPSLSEALAQLALAPAAPSSRPDLAGALGDALLDLTAARVVALTLDADGALVFDRGAPPLSIAATHRGPAHPAGAGDTFLAAFTLSLCAGAPTSEAASIASAAAGIVVAEPGTSSCSLRDLRSALGAGPERVLARERLGEELDRARSARPVASSTGAAGGAQVVFTNGCFDLIHPGHIALLEHARRLGDILVVGVNTDEGVARLKGDGRPVNPLEQRLRVLSAISSVDYLVAFEEPTAAELIELVRPDVYVKGGDYRPDTIPEAPAVAAVGGRIEILPCYGSESTTRMIERIRGLARNA